MENFRKLTEFEESILRYIQDRSSTIGNIIEEFSSIKRNAESIVHAVNILENEKEYIKQKDRIIGAFGPHENDLIREINIYSITPLGKNYLANTTANFTSFSNINNSNVAHNSSNVTQSINISKQPQDIQEKIKEIELAIIKKDASGIKKAFSYIADKSVDVAIALLTGGLLK
ncbi:MAG TPA: hypothetical protein PLS49_05170 [Candidatus Woesebacteria bacterium]|nr:hypothetical protein [Candidatus Woesebacteria bacterium]